MPKGIVVLLFLLSLLATPVVGMNDTEEVCGAAFIKVASTAREFFAATQESSEGNKELQALVELAELANETVHRFNNGESEVFQTSPSHLKHSNVGEVVATTTPFNYFSPRIIASERKLSLADIVKGESPRDRVMREAQASGVSGVSNETKLATMDFSELKKLVNQVEIPDSVANFIVLLNHELSGVKPNGNGAPQLSLASQKKQRFIEEEILPELKRLFKTISPLRQVSGRKTTLEELIKILEDGHKGRAEYDAVRARYGIENGSNVYEKIFDLTSQEVISDFPELPRKIRKQLLALVLKPQAEIISKTEAFAQKHPESLFGEVRTELTAENYRDEEIKSGRVIAYASLTTGLVFRKKVEVPVLLLKALPEENAWLVAPYSQTSSTVSNDIEIYKIPTQKLSISNFPADPLESSTNTQSQINAQRLPFQNLIMKVFIPPDVIRERTIESRLGFILGGAGVSSPEHLNAKKTDGIKSALVETTEETRPIKVSRYPDSKTLETAGRVLKAIVTRDFLLNEGKRKLRATLEDLKQLEKFYTLNGPDNASIEAVLEKVSLVDRAQLEAIALEGRLFRERFDKINSEAKKVMATYELTDIQNALKSHVPTEEIEKRQELIRRITTKLIEVEAKLESTKELTGEKIGLTTVHEGLKEALEHLAGPQNKEMAERWLTERKAEIEKERKTVGFSTFETFKAGLSEIDRALIVKHANPKAFKMISVIKPGEQKKFTLGSPNHEAGRSSDEAQKEVVLTSPVLFQAADETQAQWASVMGSNPSYFKDASRLIKINGIEVDPNRPVEQVSFWSARFYCNERSKKEGLEPVYDFSNVKFKGDAKDGTLDATGEVIINKKAKGYRLPTEAEWEYATRAGTTTRYYFGDNEADLPQHGYYSANSGNKTQPVAQLKPNNLGLYDMHGNVWKWTEDWYSSETPSGTDPTGPVSGSYRVMRGGSWGNDARHLRSAYRSRGGPGDRYYNVGFRVVRTP